MNLDITRKERKKNGWDSKRYTMIFPMQCDNQFQLTTDASGLAFGAVLSNSNSRPIAYASKCLNKPELNYLLLAVVWAVRHFRPYLYE